MQKTFKSNIIMSKTKELLLNITPDELKDLEILYEIIGPECDDSKLI